MAIDLVAKLVPDVVLMDVNMSGIGGVEATRGMPAAGASAHLSKSAPTGEIVRAVRGCLQQGSESPQATEARPKP